MDNTFNGCDVAFARGRPPDVHKIGACNLSKISSILIGIVSLSLVTVAVLIKYVRYYVLINLERKGENAFDVL